MFINNLQCVYSSWNIHLSLFIRLYGVILLDLRLLRLGAVSIYRFPPLPKEIRNFSAHVPFFLFQIRSLSFEGSTFCCERGFRLGTAGSWKRHSFLFLFFRCGCILGLLTESDFLHAIFGRWRRQRIVFGQRNFFRQNFASTFEGEVGHFDAV